MADGEPPENIIGVGWRKKTWGPKQLQNMQRIYTQGPLDDHNDSVKMLRHTIQYAKEKNLKVLFYLTPQNEELIGAHFPLEPLRRNEDFLWQVLQEEGAWAVDLRGTVPENEFADYDHLLKEGNRRLADRLTGEAAGRGIYKR